MVVLGGEAVSYERGTPAHCKATPPRACQTLGQPGQDEPPSESDVGAAALSGRMYLAIHDGISVCTLLAVAAWLPAVCTQVRERNEGAAPVGIWALRALREARL